MGGVEGFWGTPPNLGVPILNMGGCKIRGGTWLFLGDPDFGGRNLHFGGTPSPFGDPPLLGAPSVFGVPPLVLSSGLGPPKGSEFGGGRQVWGGSGLGAPQKRGGPQNPVGGRQWQDLGVQGRILG